MIKLSAFKHHYPRLWVSRGKGLPRATTVGRYAGELVAPPHTMGDKEQSNNDETQKWQCSKAKDPNEVCYIMLYIIVHFYYLFALKALASASRRPRPLHLLLAHCHLDAWKEDCRHPASPPAEVPQTWVGSNSTPPPIVHSTRTKSHR